MAYDYPYLAGTYAQNTKNSFDILAWHPYGWQVGPDNPNSQYNVLNKGYSSIAAANGDSSKPIFLNEVGFSTNQQGGMNWEQQGLALSRMFMMAGRNPNVQNVSWWGIVDESPIGSMESDLYVSHMGLIAKDSSGNLQIKPSYYTFKNFGINKGVIIDLASYDSSGTLVKEDYRINKIVFSSLGDDIDSVNVLSSWKNTNDWQNVSVTKTVSQNSRGTYDYTITFPTTYTRFVQLQFVKKASVSQYSIDEVQVLDESGANVALNKYYAAAGFSDNSSTGPINFSGTNPTPSFTYTIDKANGQLVLTNTTSPGTATVTGYLWFNGNTQISNQVNYSYPITQNQDLNIVLYAYYTGGSGGFVVTKSQLINTGTWTTAVNPTPSFTYTIDPTNQQVILKNTTQPAQGSTITGYLWFNGNTQISNQVNYNYPTTQNTDLNIGLYVYYTGGTNGYVQTTSQKFNTGSWSTQTTPTTPPSNPSVNPTPSFTYTIDKANKQIILTNTTKPASGSTITGYLWFNGNTQISNQVNYNYPTTQNTDLNIGLYVYYTGGTNGYVQTTFKKFNTGVWSENPTPNFTYTIDKVNKRLILTNTSTPGTGTITGYLWFNGNTQISNQVNYSMPISQMQDLNIVLYTYYVNGASGYVVTKSQKINTGDWTAPSAPSGLKSVLSGSKNSLSWKPSSDNVKVSGYNIYRNSILIGTTLLTTFTDYLSFPGMTYTYIIKAFDTSNNVSGASNSVSVKLA
jgi:hypothetical protein